MSAEIVAIIKAIDYANSKNINELVIFTDSKNTCTLLAKPFQTENSLIIKLLNDINQSDIQKIYVQWIPSHIGLIGNDRADHAAKMGTTRNVEETIGYTLEDMFNLFKNEVNKQWQDQYEQISIDKGKFHYEHSKIIDNKPWFKGLNLSTIETIQIGRIRTGHVVTKNKLANWNLVANSRCDHCGDNEDLTHILHYCPKYESVRKNISILNNKTPIVNILINNNPGEYIQIVKYLKRINKYV